MDQIVISKFWVGVPEKLNLDVIDAELKGSFRLTCYEFGTKSKIAGEGCRIKTGRRKIVKIDGKSVSKAKSEGGAPSESKA